MQQAHSTMRPLVAGRCCRLALLAFCVVTVAFTTACARARAQTVPDGPPLAVPAPPPRVITPVEEVIVAAPPPAAPEPTAAAPRTPPRQPARPEPRPETPPVTAAPPPAAPAAPVEPREVRAVPSASAAVEEKKVRDVMFRASRDLNRVDYRKLSAEGQSQYNQSKRFSEQAEQALKEKNFVYAMTLAEKAATLAVELAGSR